MKAIRLATRGSPLALAQSGQVKRAIEIILAREVEIVTVRTTGDRIQDRSLATLGGKGLFVNEIEQALMAGRADLAVHSAKDLPARLADGCVLAAFPERADPRDAWVARDEQTLQELPSRARIGTGSARRASQLLARRPDLRIEAIRGNVDTRLRKLDEGAFDGIVLACAGLDRLQRSEVITQRIAPDWILPAVAQGTLALETRADDPIASELRAIEHPATRTRTLAERGFLVRIGGDCDVPLAAFAQWRGEDLTLSGRLALPDGSRIAEASASLAPTSDDDARALGERVAEQILRDGGDEILKAIAS